MGLNPRLWASFWPRQPTYPKPNHYAEMLRLAWENRDQLGYAWRILNQGVCDGCALGTAGLRDWTMPGVRSLRSYCMSTSRRRMLRMS
jgi:hypothetical protein